MPEDYQDLVLAAYKKKKEDGELSLILSNPTTAKLKRECLKIYDNRCRYGPQDDDILATFFNVDKMEGNFRQVISRAEPDEFKPLLNHLKERTGKTDDKNSELLAWLIDFQPRPSTLYYKSLYEKPQVKDELIIEELVVEEGIVPSNIGIGDEDMEKDNISGESTIVDIGKDNQEILEKEQPKYNINEGVEEATTQKDTLPDGVKKGEKKKNDSPGYHKIVDTGNDDQAGPGQKGGKLPVPTLKIIMLCMVALVVGIGAFQFRGNKNDKIISLFTNQECMYWTGDHYQPIACDQKKGDTPIIALDTQKVAHLKKITRPDTLTENALGKVWYVKVNNMPEFYTDSGSYPMDIKKELKPMTQYILDKYILK